MNNKKTILAVMTAALSLTSFHTLAESEFSPKITAFKQISEVINTDAYQIPSVKVQAETSPGMHITSFHAHYSQTDGSGFVVLGSPANTYGERVEQIISPAATSFSFTLGNIDPGTYQLDNAKVCDPELCVTYTGEELVNAGVVKSVPEFEVVANVEAKEPEIVKFKIDNPEIDLADDVPLLPITFQADSYTDALYLFRVNACKKGEPGVCVAQHIYHPAANQAVSMDITSGSQGENWTVGEWKIKEVSAAEYDARWTQRLSGKDLKAITKGKLSFEVIDSNAH